MSSNPIRTVVIPAAGRGSRFFPATKVIPKEMMPISGRPIIQFAVEEAATSGLETVVLVLRRGKESIAEHFQTDDSIEETVTRKANMHDAATALRHLSERIDVRTVFQEAPLGLADAVRTARPLIGDEAFAVILPDALIDSPVPCTRQLMDSYAKYSGCIVATQMVEAWEVQRFGMLETTPVQNGLNDNRTMRVTSLVERPRSDSTPSRHGIFGRYILEPDIFGSIECTRPGLNGELQLTDALMVHTTRASVFAYHFDGTHYDVGSKLGFVEATIAYALKDPELAPVLRKRLAYGTPAPETTSFV
jgi:UTP--glucose-1-phosphate uridylyltransferase